MYEGTWPRAIVYAMEITRSMDIIEGSPEQWENPPLESQSRLGSEP